MRGGYPSYAEIAEARARARRERALAALARASASAAGAGGSLRVFGSLVTGGFGERSDLDVALFGVPAGRDSEVAARVQEELELAGFPADVIPERFLSPSLRERVERDGREPGALG